MTRHARQAHISLLTAALPALLAGTATGLDLPQIEFDVIPGPVLPAVASDVGTEGADRGFIVLVPEIDAAIAFRITKGDDLDPSSPFPVGGLARFVVVGDVDGDGRDDLVTTAPTTGRAHIALQTENGLYQLGSVLPVGSAPFAPALRDLDGNGLPELVIPLRGESAIAVLPNLGDGLFGAGYRIPCAAQPDAVALADFDRDGIVDLAAACTGAARIQVFYGDKNGSLVDFNTPPIELTTGSGPVGLIAEDFDGDGVLDLATASTGSSSVSIFYGNPGRSFEPGPFLFAGTSPQSLLTVDLDRNGATDLVVANPSTQMLTVLQNRGDRGFIRSTVPMPFRPSRIAATDFSADGRVDLLASSQTTVQTRLLRNETQTADCVGDVNGDLRVDLQDLNLVLANFGTSQTGGDANSDGQVNLLDLNLVLAGFDTVCGER
jgi:hypothetical protein